MKNILKILKIEDMNINKIYMKKEKIEWVNF